MNPGKNTVKDDYLGALVLVTGGASFIGSALVERLVECGARVTVADNLSSGLLGNLDAVKTDIEFLEGDLREPGFARRACKGQQVVFHLAASHGGRGYIDSHPVECSNNLVLDHTVFAASTDADKIVYASSACVYPVNLQENDDEEYLLCEAEAGLDAPGQAFADGEYGWAKLMGEMQLRAFHKQYGVNAVACRLFTAYGERENESHAVIALIAKALARLDPYPVWGNGEQTRNFTYVGDTVHGMVLAGAMLAGCHVINIGTDRHTSVNELVSQLLGQIGWRPERFHYQLDKPVGVRSRASDNSRIEKLLGWSPRTGLDEGLRRTIDWYAGIATPQRLARLNEHLMEREAVPDSVPS